MSLKTLSLKVALAKVMSELVAERVSAARDAVLEATLDLHRQVGLKSVDVDLPDGTNVGTISLTQPKDKFAVVDRNAFIAWVEQNHPGEVEYVPTVRPSFEKVLLEKWAESTSDGVVITDTDTGEQKPVDGVEFKPAGDPTAFSIRFAKDAKKGIDGREKVAEYLDTLGLGQFGIESSADELTNVVASEVVKDEQDAEVPA